MALATTMDARDPDVFRTAVDVLANISTARRPTANNFAVAIASLAHGPLADRDWVVGQPPSDPISSYDLQMMCDAAWRKRDDFLFGEVKGPIFKPFKRTFKPPSPGNNNWRATFNLQSGFGCDAPFDEEFLLSSDFVAENRFSCVFREEHTMHCLAPRGGSAAPPKCFDVGKSRGEPPTSDDQHLARPKFLARAHDSSGRLLGYWLVPQSPTSLVGLLASQVDRVPALAFAAALYGGSDYWMAQPGGSEISIERLKSDLAVDDDCFLALFDPTPENAGNARVASVRSPASGPSSSGLVPSATPHSAPRSPLASPDIAAPQPVAADDIDLDAINIAAGALADPEERARLLERAVKGHQRVLKVLIANLTAAGYACSQQSGGFDLAATHPQHGAHLFEVKTFTEGNLTKQIRSGWAQLYEYRFRNAGLWPDPPHLYLVFDHEPTDELWLWSWLQDQLGVTPCWVDDAGVLHTFPGGAALLPPID